MSEDDASVGTLVRVPKRGVYEVVSLGEVFGQRFYALARCGGPEQDRLRLPDFVGCERVEEASGGSLITAEHAERILSSLGRLEPIHPDNWIRRNEAYREILRNLDPDEMARLMQDLSRNEKAAPRDVERARAFLLEHCSRARRGRIGDRGSHRRRARRRRRFVSHAGAPGKPGTIPPRRP